MNLGERLFAALERAPRGIGEDAAQHRGAADRVGRNAGRVRDRVGHQAREGTLTQFACEQTHDEVGLGRSRTREQISQDRLARRGGSRPGGGRNVVEDVVELRDRHGRPAGSSTDATAHRGECRPADTDAALARLAREQAHDRCDLVGSARAQ